MYLIQRLCFLRLVLLRLAHEIIISMCKSEITKPDRVYHSHDQNRCLACGRFFKASPQVDGQKYCSCSQCQKQRKKINQAIWVDHNPDYFKGRYSYIQEWRAKNPNYQKEQRAKKRREIQDSIKAKSSIISVQLLITDQRLKVEIQDAIRAQKAIGRGFLIYGYPTRDTRPDSQPDTT